MESKAPSEAPSGVDPFSPGNRSETRPVQPSRESLRTIANEREETSELRTEEKPSRTGTAAIAPVPNNQSGDSNLLDEPDAESFRQRWKRCQTTFVDEPRASVQSADELVAEVMQTVAARFVATRESLESHWDSGDNVSTEDLRLALQKYREFFNRLLAV